ncbi:hypothetical protein [Crocosphaera sp. Alani8]|uniref:hypothetical protein n=1 Tax=Crocosphaera sp. Alani8 TaxID=3038952 RepID=UPI00313BB344
MPQTKEKQQTIYTLYPSCKDSIKYTESVKQLSIENWVEWVISVINDCQHFKNIVVNEVQKWVIHYQNPISPMILFQCEQKGEIVLEFELNWCDYVEIRIDGLLYEGVTLVVIDGVVTVPNEQDLS